MLAGLPYVVWPVGSVFILASRKKDDPFLHYHAVQGGLFGAVLLAVCLLGFLALAITFRLLPGSYYVAGMLGMGTLLGGGFAAMTIFFTAIFLGWRATEGEMLRLPFLGDFAEQKMLDHTGMTRREFLKVLEEAFIEPQFDEPEPIPFPAYGTPAMSEKAQEILAARVVDDVTPAAQKAAEILAHRQAKQAAEQKAKLAAQQALQASQQAANLAAQQAAALQAAQRSVRPSVSPTQEAAGTRGWSTGQQRPSTTEAGRPGSQPAAAPRQPGVSPGGAGPTPSGAGPTPSGPGSQPAGVARPAASAAVGAPAARPASSAARVGATPAPAATPPSKPPVSAQPSRSSAPHPQSPEGRAKSFPLIAGSASPGASATPVRSSPPAAPPSTAPGQVRDVDLIRHYRERQKPESDALRKLLD